MAAAEKLAGLAGALVFAAAGVGWLETLPGLRSLPRGRRLGLAYLLGVAWVAGSLYALSHFGGVPLRPSSVLAVTALPILAGTVARIVLGAAHRRRPRRPWGWLEWVALAIAAAVCRGAVARAVTNPLHDWDGRMTWATQARYVRAEATVDARALAEPQWYVSHPQYPLLLPIAQVVAMEVAGAGDDVDAFRLLYVAFLPVFFLILYGFPRRRVRRRTAALTVMAAALLPFPAFFPTGGAVSAYSDLPLACFYGAALLLLLAARPRLSHGIAAGLLLAAAVLSKN